MGEPGVGRMRDRLLLYSGIYRNPFEIFGVDRPGAVGHDSESRRRRNHGPPKSGIPNRKKTGMHTRLSCKIDYLLRSNHRDRSIASSFFTDDGRLSGDRSDELVIQVGWQGIWVASINPIERYT